VINSIHSGQTTLYLHSGKMGLF